MDTSTITTGILGVGFLGAIWNKLQLYWSKVCSLFFVAFSMSGPGAYAMLKFIVFNCRCSRLGSRYIYSLEEFVRSRDRSQVVAFEGMLAEPMLWFYGYCPFMLEVKTSMDIRLTFLRGTIDIKQFILKVIDEYNEDKYKENVSFDRFRVVHLTGRLGEADIRRSSDTPVKAKVELAGMQSGGVLDKFTSFPIGYSRDDLGCSLQTSKVELLSLRPNVLQAMDEAVLWLKSETWFIARNIPWKRGWLLHGLPGTGKTAFTRSLGRRLNFPIYVFDLTTMSNSDFLDCWDRARANAPCIALFEDIDNIFNGRKNIAVVGHQQGLTFDCLLNALDGADSTNGMFTVVTTNDMSKIDPALGNPSNGDGMSTRPGRIDRVIEFLPLDTEGRLKMAQRIFGDFPRELWEYVFETGKNDTGAQFQERCCRKALELFWSKHT